MKRAGKQRAPKDPAIQRVIERLSASLGEGEFQIVSHWDNEADAVGFAHPENEGRLAYVCAYDTGYFVSLELPPKPGLRAPYRDAGSFDDIDLDAVIRIVREHLACDAA